MSSSNHTAGWSAFRSIVLWGPWVFLVVALCTSHWATARWILALIVVTSACLLLPRKARPEIALHVLVGALLVYQTTLLYRTRDEANVGIVWFLVVPALVASLGRRSHTLVWTPITLGCVVLSWYWTRHHAAMEHPLSLPNLVGATICISIAAFAVAADRHRRERELLGALDDAGEHLRRRQSAELSARRSATSMAHFAASVSHELRTPLTSLVLASEMLLHGLDDESDLENAQSVHKSAKVLLDLSQDVLELARLNVEEISPDSAEFEIESLCEDLRAVMAPHCARRGVILFVGAGPEIRRSYVGDAPRIRQVLLNLLGNAVRHTDAGAVRVSIRPIADGLGIRVRDSGTGIEAENLDAIFEPFVRFASEEAPLDTGTGLGLSIARGLVEAMEGTIEVESTVGVETSFGIELPLRPASTETLGDLHPVAEAHLERARHFRASGRYPDVDAWAEEWLDHWGVRSTGSETCTTDDLGPVIGSVTRLARALRLELAPPAARSDAAPSGGAEPTPRGTCLVCDDDPAVREVLGRLLEHIGYRVSLTAEPDEALRCVREAPFDIVMLDAQLGSKSGLDLLRTLRRLDAPAGETPICVLSGSPKHRATALEAGADAYLVKPSSLADLSRVTASLAQRRRSTKRDRNIG